ncbi:MAG: RNA polymerase sigma-70 factor [Bacteroidetes bacterium]|nr:MAG: RNA polymerase sigma-70 factor [Bacteroidota bacterium]
MHNPEQHNTFSQKDFEQLFKAHFMHLCNFAHQYVPDKDSARDITQKVFINLWENRNKIDPGKSVRSYLFTSVRNRCLNYIRDQKKYRSNVLDVEINDYEFSFEEDHMAVEELKGRIEEALQVLPSKCRQVFEMSRYKNMKYKDIAEELDVSVKTVEAHMSRALKTLRERLEDYIFLLILIYFF